MVMSHRGWHDGAYRADAVPALEQMGLLQVHAEAHLGSPSWITSMHKRDWIVKNPYESMTYKKSGGEEEDRTPDLRIANATLSQLSYPPTTGHSLAKVDRSIVITPSYGAH